MNNKIFSVNDFEQLRRLVREGRTINEAAATLECSPTTIYRHLADEPEWKAQIDEDRSFAREQKAERAEAIAWRIAGNDDHNRQWDALNRLLNGFHPELQEQAQRVEVSGGDKPIQIEARRVTTLADLVAYAEPLGALDTVVDGDARPGGAPRALPAAPDAGATGDSRETE